MAVADGTETLKGYTATGVFRGNVCLYSQMLQRSLLMDAIEESPAIAIAAIGDGMSATVKITKEVEVFLAPASKVDVLRQIDIAA